jgi:uncharacterized membrane protein
MTWTMRVCLPGTVVLLVAIGAGWRTASMNAQGAAATDFGPITVIDVPGAANDSPLDINAEGVIVGRYASSGRTHGFVRSAAGDFTTLDVPGAVFTAATSINERGDIVGQFALPTAPNDRHGFLLKDGEFTSFDPPGSHFTNALAINDRGDIVGRYCTVAACTAAGTGTFHAFTLRDRGFTLFDAPGALETDAFGINSRGSVAGGFVNGQQQEQLFVLDNDVFTTFALPEGEPAALDKGSMNERGDIVGGYCSGAAPCLTTLTAAQHAFLMRDGVFTSFDVPGARATLFTGINARGDIVGTYSDGSRFHGFLIDAGGGRDH